MRSLEKAVFFILIFGIVGCGGSREKEIQRILDSPVDYDSNLSPWANMQDYTTWAWVPMPKAVDIDPRASDPKLREAIENAVGQQMKVRGYVRSATTPDLYVNYQLAEQKIDEQYIEKMYNGSYWPNYRMDFQGSGKARKEWDQGTLLVFVFDAKSQSMVWQGSATAEITDEAPEQKSLERLNTVIKTLFTSLPGKPSWQSNP